MTGGNDDGNLFPWADNLSAGAQGAISGRKEDLMKILGINGSYRGNNGFTSSFIKKIFEGAAQEGAECELINLSEKKIMQCIDCKKCHSKNQYLRCIYHDKDDVASIFDKMKEVDLIIYATPVYIFSMSGLMKMFFDRFYSSGDTNMLRLTKSGLMFHHIPHEICSKPFAVLVCGDNMENKTYSNIISYFKSFSEFMDAELVGTIIRKSALFFGDESRKEIRSKIQKVGEALFETGKELATIGRIRRSTERRAAGSILPIPPIFGIFKQFRFFKKIMIGKVNEFIR
jgi:multimeric flavodoxin WrbA